MSDILKVSFILPHEDCSKNSVDLINWCAKNQKIDLVCLIWLPRKTSSLKRFLKNSLWQLILCPERYRSKLNLIKKETLLSYIKCDEQLLIYEYNNCNKEIINKLDIDLHIALDPNANIISLKNHSRLGAIVFNNKNPLLINNNNPSFFDEVLSQKNITQFSILLLQPNNNKTVVIEEGAFPTHGYFTANRENVLLRQNFYMQKSIERILENKIIIKREHIDTDTHNLDQFPSLTDQCRYCFHLTCLLLRRLAALIAGEQSWNVGLHFGDWKSVDFQKTILIQNPKQHFLADPFVIDHDDKSYCFVEDYDMKKSKGVISVYEINEEKVSKIGVALEEKFHLSFPYLFKCDSKIYMLPESCCNKDIRIYESVEFPLKWKLARVIASDVSAVDSMIFQQNNLWWLFSNINPINGRDTCSELSIFYADHPIAGEWLPHSKNPVIFNPLSARNGGIIIENNAIYRVGQKQIFGTYGGGGFSINQIIELDPNNYREDPVLIVNPDFFKGNKGAHHFHSNGNISAFGFLT